MEVEVRGLLNTHWSKANRPETTKFFELPSVVAPRGEPLVCGSFGQVHILGQEQNYVGSRGKSWGKPPFSKGPLHRPGEGGGGCGGVECVCVCV